jgi:hypothetical protein
MKPTDKSLKINQLINSTFKIDRENFIRENKCVFCMKQINPIIEFQDDLSRREFQISGLCQECQNRTFGK